MRFAAPDAPRRASIESGTVAGEFDGDGRFAAPDALRRPGCALPPRMDPAALRLNQVLSRASSTVTVAPPSRSRAE